MKNRSLLCCTFLTNQKSPLFTLDFWPMNCTTEGCEGFGIIGTSACLICNLKWVELWVGRGEDVLFRAPSMAFIMWAVRDTGWRLFRVGTPLGGTDLRDGDDGGVFSQLRDNSSIHGGLDQALENKPKLVISEYLAWSLICTNCTISLGSWGPSLFP